MVTYVLFKNGRKVYETPRKKGPYRYLEGLLGKRNRSMKRLPKGYRIKKTKKVMEFGKKRR